MCRDSDTPRFFRRVYERFLCAGMGFAINLHGVLNTACPAILHTLLCRRLKKAISFFFCKTFVNTHAEPP